MSEPYATVSEAETYFSERLYIDAWTALNLDNKLKALKMATRAIEKLNFAGDKADELQAMQFPRGKDTVVPQDVKDAACEEALAIAVLGADVESVADVARTKRQKIGDAETEWDTFIMPMNIVAGIQSMQAWRLLYPYLRDPNIIDLDRT